MLDFSALIDSLVCNPNCIEAQALMIHGDVWRTLINTVIGLLD